MSGKRSKAMRRAERKAKARMHKPLPHHIAQPGDIGKVPAQGGGCLEAVALGGGMFLTNISAGDLIHVDFKPSSFAWSGERVPAGELRRLQSLMSQAAVNGSFTAYERSDE